MAEHSDGFTELVSELVKAFPSVSRVEYTVRMGPGGEQVVVCAVEFDNTLVGYEPVDEEKARDAERAMRENGTLGPLDEGPSVIFCKPCDREKVMRILRANKL